jgi:tetratricopeptide (TPR) repeat protein
MLNYSANMNHPAARIFLVVVAVCVLHLHALGQSKISPTLVERYAEQGQSELTAGHYQAAEKAYEKLRALRPRVGEVHANLGLIYFKERKFDEAVPELREALRLKPSLIKTEGLLAATLSELGRYSNALPELEKCFHHSPDAEIKRMCGLQLERTYTGLKRDSGAVEVALELNRLYPDDPEIMYQTGKVYGNFAFLTIQKLVHVAPASVWKYLAAAEAYESQGYYTRAIVEYRQVLALEPQRPGIHYRLGRSLLARSSQVSSPQDVTDAASEFEQELHIFSRNANAAYELGEIRRKQSNFEEAQRFFELALQSYPDFEEAQVGLASVLVSTQKPALALPHLRKAIQLNSANEATWYRLSQAERALGNATEQQKALAEFQRLHSLASQNDLEPVFSPHEVTKQKIDSNVAQ